MQALQLPPHVPNVAKPIPSIRLHHIPHIQSIITEAAGISGLNPETIHTQRLPEIPLNTYFIQLGVDIFTGPNVDDTYRRDLFGSDTSADFYIRQFAKKIQLEFQALAQLPPENLIAITTLHDSIICRSCALKIHCTDPVQQEYDWRFMLHLFNASQIQLSTGLPEFEYVLAPKSALLLPINQIYTHTLTVADHPKNIEIMNSY